MSCGSSTPLLNAISLGGVNLAAAQGCGARVCTPVKRPGSTLVTFPYSVTGTDYTLLSGFQVVQQPLAYARIILTPAVATFDLDVSQLSIKEIVSVALYPYDITTLSPTSAVPGAGNITATLQDGVYTTLAFSGVAPGNKELVVTYVPR